MKNVKPEVLQNLPPTSETGQTLTNEQVINLSRSEDGVGIDAVKALNIILENELNKIVNKEADNKVQTEIKKE